MQDDQLCEVRQVAKTILLKMLFALENKWLVHKKQGHENELSLFNLFETNVTILIIISTN